MAADPIDPAGSTSPRAWIGLALAIGFGLLILPLAGCLGSSPGEGTAATETNATESGEPLEATEIQPINETSQNATEAEQPPANETTAPPARPPDPCSEPVAGLDHPCIADGLHLGDAVFWDGGSLPDWRSSGYGVDYVSTIRPYVNLGPAGQVSASPSDHLGASTCKDTTGCIEHTFEVAESAPGARLRVDAQIFFEDPSYVRPHADTIVWGHETGIMLRLFPPSAGEGDDREPADVSNTIGGFAASLGVGGYDPETRRALDAPETGTWTLQISGLLPGEFDYRLRAKLVPPSPPSNELAFPDMRIIAPFEVGFMVPTTTFQPGAPSGIAAPGATCMAEEYEEAVEEDLPPPTVCLRFSMGFYNSGDGALRLKEVRSSDLATEAQQLIGTEDIALVQNVCTPHGRSCIDVPELGHPNSRWHSSHLHYHYQNAYVFDLLRVHPSEHPGDAASLEHVSTSGKLGLDPGPEAMEGWGTFYQLALPQPEGHDTEGNPDPIAKGMQAGWGDIYEWNRAGNYVDFPIDDTGQPIPGAYVLRGTTDPDGELVETNETNNQAYTLFRVSGLGDVEILERGYGSDPWDATKIIHEVTP